MNDVRHETRSSVVFQLRDERAVRVYAGGLIGPSTVCHLYFPDPQISEVHAMVSERFYETVGRIRLGIDTDTRTL